MRRAVAALLLFAACSEHKSIDLTFGGERVPRGFHCREGLVPLVARALDRRTLRFALVIDFVALDGLPTCRPGDIADFCVKNTCTPLPAPRLCHEIEHTLTGDENVITAVAAELAKLDGLAVTDDAPHDPVIIRAVASAQTCAELPAGTPADPMKVIGCATSCPIQLAGVEGEVLLELPTLTDQCVDAVLKCAAGSFTQ